MSAAIALLASYLLGSVPFALIAARAKGVDLRVHGSGNLGATNAIRVLGAGIGVPVLLADVLKGLVSVTVFPRLLGVTGAEVPLLCGAAAVCGHVWSVFLRFRGGKGVAAAAGAFLGLAPGALGIAAAVFAVVLLFGRYVSLASLIGSVTLPLALWRTGAARSVLAAGVAIAVLVIVRHRTNLARLLAGTESRIGSRKGGGS
jgi:glycerol-3-phosphate acyltransferase PlsY